MRTCGGINAMTPCKHQHDSSRDKKPHAWFMREQRDGYEDGNADQQQANSNRGTQDFASHFVQELVRKGVFRQGSRTHARRRVADRFRTPQIKRRCGCNIRGSTVGMDCRRALLVPIGPLLRFRECFRGIVGCQRALEEVSQLRRQPCDLALG